MPYPQNLETAKSVESIITSSGCVPATIAVLNGRVKVGLTSAELTSLAKSGEDGRATKVTTREVRIHRGGMEREWRQKRYN